MSEDYNLDSESELDSDLELITVNKKEMIKQLDSFLSNDKIYRYFDKLFKNNDYTNFKFSFLEDAFYDYLDPSNSLDPEKVDVVKLLLPYMPFSITYINKVLSLDKNRFEREEDYICNSDILGEIVDYYTENVEKTDNEISEIVSLLISNSQYDVLSRFLRKNKLDINEEIFVRIWNDYDESYEYQRFFKNMIKRYCVIKDECKSFINIDLNNLY